MVLDRHLVRDAVPPEGMPRLHRQLQEIRRELENTVSPSLVAELRRIAPPNDHDQAPSATALRIECAVLTSWTGSLSMQMLTTLAAPRKRLSHPAATA